MSSNRLTSTNSRGWRFGNEHGASSADHDRRRNWRPGVPRPVYRQPEEDLYSPWSLFEERVRTGPFGLTRFPLQPHSPVRVLVLDGSSEVSPRLTQFIRNNTPPRIRGEWHIGGQAAPEPEDPGLSEGEFKKAMKKLRKHVYNPPYPRRRAWKRGLFSSRTISGSGGGGSSINDEEEKEEGKDCTICLESFVANEQVLMTPCNHMFHGDCLVPWVKSQGKCPVCRFVLCERKENAAAVRGNEGGGTGVVSPGYYGNARDLDDGLALDVVTLIRAMDEAFNWVNYARAAPHGYGYH